LPFFLISLLLVIMKTSCRNTLRTCELNSAVKLNFWPKLIIGIWWSCLVMLIKEMNGLLLQSMCPMVLSENIWMVSICNYKRGKVQSTTTFMLIVLKFLAVQRGKILDFNQRLEISIDVAHGLTYLHLYAGRLFYF